MWIGTVNGGDLDVVLLMRLWVCAGEIMSGYLEMIMFMIIMLRLPVTELVDRDASSDVGEEVTSDAVADSLMSFREGVQEEGRVGEGLLKSLSVRAPR